eukprot:290380-Rhodomonas_salina.3
MSAGKSLPVMVSMDPLRTIWGESSLIVGVAAVVIVSSHALAGSQTAGPPTIVTATGRTSPLLASSCISILHSIATLLTVQTTQSVPPTETEMLEAMLGNPRPETVIVVPPISEPTVGVTAFTIEVSLMEAGLNDSPDPGMLTETETIPFLGPLDAKRSLQTTLLSVTFHTTQGWSPTCTDNPSPNANLRPRTVIKAWSQATLGSTAWMTGVLLPASLTAQSPAHSDLVPPIRTSMVATRVSVAAAACPAMAPADTAEVLYHSTSEIAPSNPAHSDPTHPSTLPGGQAPPNTSAASRFTSKLPAIADALTTTPSTYKRWVLPSKETAM